MATIMDLYNNATKNKLENEIYGKSSVFIESRGVINIPRQIALLASSPNSIADLIGGQVAGLLGGSATHPSDTIFKNNKPFTKPITIANGIAIEKGKIKDIINPEENYYVKQSPNPASFIQRVNQGTSNPLQTAANIAADALRNPLSTAKSLNRLKNSLKNKPNENSTYGAQATLSQIGTEPPKKETIKFTEYFPIYEIVSGSPNHTRTKIQKREDDASWDTANNNIIQNILSYREREDLNNITRVIITQYGNKDKKIVLPGTITGLSEDFSPEWTNFKYVGSPFNVYRYTGVERNVKFNLKLYYTDQISKSTMIDNLNALRQWVFPNEELSAVSYGNQINSLAFSPNLVYFTITGLYNNLFAYIEELSFTIDDNISWGVQYDRDRKNDEFTSFEKNNDAPYPTVIDVSLGFKIIPNFGITKDQSTPNVYRYNYNFTNGGNIDEIESDYPRPDPKVNQAKTEKTSEKNYVMANSQNSQPNAPFRTQTSNRTEFVTR
jgi:hypothetical protein